MEQNEINQEREATTQTSGVPLKRLVSWVSKALHNTTFFICVFPFFVIGYVSQKIASFVVTGFFIGWEYSRDLEGDDNA